MRHFGDAPFQVVARGRAEGAHGTEEGGGIGDDVADGACDEAANGNHRRVAGANLAADERVEDGREVRAGDDWIDTEVRPCGVDAAAGEGDFEPIRGGGGWARGREE